MRLVICLMVMTLWCSEAWALTYKPLTPEQKAENERRRELAQYCSKLQHSSWSHVNFIGVVKFTGKRQAYKYLYTGPTSGEAVDMYFSVENVLKGEAEQEIAMQHLLVNAASQGVSEQEYIDGLYVPDGRYLLMAAKSPASGILTLPSGEDYEKEWHYREVEMLLLD